jgi:hypothetical protein
MAIQPDVLTFVRDWLRAQSAGTDLASVAILTYEDEGRHTPPFALLEEAGFLRHPEVPAYLPFRLSVTIYARTNREASSLYRTLTDLLHGAVNVLADDGVGFWSAQDETGPQPGPEGGWPTRTGVVALYMPDRALPLSS